VRVLLTGGSGLLGGYVREVFGRRHEVIARDREDGDVAEFGDFRRIFRDARPDFLLHAAAFTDVDGAEARPDEARAVNAEGAGHAAALAAEAGIPLLLPSTDYVFDGTKEGAYEPDDPPRPISVYGATKREGEDLVRKRCPRAFIVRTSWLYGRNRPNFVDRILERAAGEETLRVVDDQRGSPTWARDLAEALVPFTDSGAFGTYHVTNAGVTTWHAFARAVFEREGLDPARVKTLSTRELARPARRPANSALSNALYARVLGPPPRAWSLALDDYLRERREKP
jgi:dTDP-4-dehydrorhamnose reductase